MSDIIETWYYRNIKDAQEDKLKEKSIGYNLVVDGILKKSIGITDGPFTYIKSNTEVKGN